MRSEVARWGAIGVFLAGAAACRGECPRGDCDEPDEDCENGRDDDGDGAADCDDDDCGCPPEDCTNGFDDDRDGDADCEDDDCELEVPCIETDCADGLDDDGDGDIDCDDRDCAGEACPWEPAYFAVEGGFAYDAATGEIGPASVGGEPNPPYVAISLVDAASMEAGDPSRGCFVLFEHAGAEPPELLPMADEAVGVTHLGIVVPTSSPDWAILTSCTADQGFRLDPAGILGTDDAIAWAQARFSEVGVGVGAPSAEVDALLDETTGDERPWHGGGGQWLASADGAAYEASGYTFAVEVDEGMGVVVEDGAYVPLLGESYASGVVHGWFTVRPATYEPL
jgi:hypothetical protein